MMRWMSTMALGCVLLSGCNPEVSSDSVTSEPGDVNVADALVTNEVSDPVGRPASSPAIATRPAAGDTTLQQGATAGQAVDGGVELPPDPCELIGEDTVSFLLDVAVIGRALPGEYTCVFSPAQIDAEGSEGPGITMRLTPADEARRRITADIDALEAGGSCGAGARSLVHLGSEPGSPPLPPDEPSDVPLAELLRRLGETMTRRCLPDAGGSPVLRNAWDVGATGFVYVGPGDETPSPTVIVARNDFLVTFSLDQGPDSAADWGATADRLPQLAGFAVAAMPTEPCTPPSDVPAPPSPALVNAIDLMLSLEDVQSLLGSDGEIVEQGEMIEWQGDAVNWTLSFVDDRVAETATRTLISKSDGDGTRYEMLNDSTTFPIGTSLAQVIAELGQPTSREEDLRIVWRFTDCSRIEARYVGGRGRDMSMR